MADDRHERRTRLIVQAEIGRPRAIDTRNTEK